MVLQALKENQRLKNEATVDNAKRQKVVDYLLGFSTELQ